MTLDRLRAMKHLIAILALLCGFAGVYAQNWADSTDIPIPPGFEEDEDARLIFDKPGGRMVEIHLYGQGEMARILSFFEDSLPQLGWEETSQGYNEDKVFRIFEREGERLTLIIFGAGQDLNLILNVEPLSE
ncbi:MAG: hypothetical protein PVF65_03420 [Sphingomonadales bacterium]|jgi:hypothetical protein